jgi:hypothetical protein
MTRLTRQQAINANCRDCCYDELNGGTWRDQVEACPSTSCPFYEYRPVTRATEDARRQQRFSAMPPDEVARRRAKGRRLAASMAVCKNEQSEQVGGAG